MILFNYFLIIIINVLINYVFLYRDRCKKLEKELSDKQSEAIDEKIHVR